MTQSPLSGKRHIVTNLAIYDVIANNYGLWTIDDTICIMKTVPNIGEADT